MKCFQLKSLLITVCWVFCAVGFSYGQRTITGTVTDAENGEALIGASVMVPGTNQGAVTDVSGGYRLALPDGATQLRVTYTGYADKMVDLGASNVVDVQLSTSALLDEVIVIGYGTVRKEDATGSVNAVSAKDFNRGAIVSPEQLVAGKIAGVQVSSNSGEPGGQTTIRIRGGTSVNASNEPLYVIDGMPIDNTAFNPGGFSGGRNPLNFLNPGDIETVTVLKDASATAIYGSRGANGVIMITTKRGKKGSAGALTYDGYYTVSQFTGELPILNTQEFRNTVTYVAPSRLEKLGTADTNWFDEITQNASGQNHALSFSGGSDNTTYRISAGYQQLQGVLRTSETERTSVGLNFNTSLLHNQLNIGTTVKGAFTKDQFDPNQIGAAWSFDPTQPVYNADDRTFAGFFEYGSTLAPRNPVSAFSQTQDYGRSFRTIANMDVEYKMDWLLPGLSAKTILGIDFTNGERERFQPTTFLNTLVSDITGEVRHENVTRTNPLLDFYLNYKRDIGERHRIDLTGGYSYQDFKGKFPSFRAYDLTSDIFGLNSITTAQEFEASTSTVNNRLISFFGRVNYAYMDKYLITATLRRDGSTRFGESNRWGWFPSAAVAWRVMQEPFAENLSNVFSDLKLRLGYGITGNQAIPDFGYLSTYAYGNVRAQYQFGYDNGLPVYVTTVRANAYDPNLKWEETSSYNIGLDFGVWSGRINGTLEYYYKRTKDLLFTVNVPAGTNLSDRVLTNIGELENSGVELSLDAYVISKPRFTWNVGFNMAYNRNQLLTINLATKDILTGGISGGVGNNIQILQEGQPINSFYVFKQKYDESGNPLHDGVDYNDDGAIDLADIYEDVNGDGKVDDQDKRPFEKPAPDLLLGISTSLTFQGFDFGFTLRGSVGNYVYNNNASNRGYFDYVGERGDIFLNNVNTSVLKTQFQKPQYFSDYYVEDGSFLRVDNVTLGYTFGNLPGKTNLRLYVTAQNPVIWTRYTGLDPEVRNGTDLNKGSGIDNNPYPRSTAWVFGLSLGL